MSHVKPENLSTSVVESVKVTKIKKRDGRIVSFDTKKITDAILGAMKDAKEGDLLAAETISKKVVESIMHKYRNGAMPGIENIQDEVEKTLMYSDFEKTAKFYIIHRHERTKIRTAKKNIPDKLKNLVAESRKYLSQFGEFIYYRTYSKWIPSLGRRETWIETVDRYISFMKEVLGNKLNKNEYSMVREYILSLKVMPSMRLLWSAGDAARRCNVAAYNCSYLAPRHLRDFAEIMYLLMCGAGVGFSCEEHVIHTLPQIQKQTRKKAAIHVIEDSREGWCDALHHGMEAWYNGHDISFDYSKIRPAGTPLLTMGGRASGPDPLKHCLEYVRGKVLAKQGVRLSTLDVHDIICKIAEIVVCGGVRRSASISLSDLGDMSLRGAKKGAFYTTHPHRMMANNSAVYNSKPTSSDFLREWVALIESETGERGIFNRGSLLHTLPARRLEKFKDGLDTCGVNPCLTADSMVYVADGRGNVSIGQLAKIGEDVPVFCKNSRNQIVIRWMRNPRLTGINMPIYKLTLDDGSIIKQTGTHQYQLKNGEYKMVKDLRFGDSLAVLTRYEASIKDVCREINAKSQDYWWVNNGWMANISEHRLIASFHHNTAIPQGYVVHHKDGNSQNNIPDNLAIVEKKEHDTIHSKRMAGENNPMRRAKKEWTTEQWNSYSKNMSVAVSGEQDGRFSGVTNEELKNHALKLTKQINRRFSTKDWIKYAKVNTLPQHFSKWREDHLGGMRGLAIWAATKLGLVHVDADPRVLQSYRKYTSLGYHCMLIDGKLYIQKKCEVCGKTIKTTIANREHGVCGKSCINKRQILNGKRVWVKSRSKIIKSLLNTQSIRKANIRDLQSKVYSDLSFNLKRRPFKNEWVKACVSSGISHEISRASSPFRYYSELQDASVNYNHKVVSVEFCGYEDVYNGTVDEFHNFFVGGFESKTRNAKRKFTYLNNLQCGEVILKNKTLCNLSEVVARPEDTEVSLFQKVKIATLLGTYQSMLTNFLYLSPEWKQNCEVERLLGVSITGYWDCPVVRKPDVLSRMKQHAIEMNKEYAKRFGISESLAITCVKPSGTVSQLVNTSPGAHARFSKYYIRRVRVSASDPLFKMLRDQKIPYHPEVGQADGEATTYVMEFPIKSPDNAIVASSLTAYEQLEHWKNLKVNYCEHNPSVTIYVRETDWIKVANWIYRHWDIAGGLSFLPVSDHKYLLSPYEEISKEKYEELVKDFPEIDYSYILAYESDDTTLGAKEIACTGGACLL